MCVIKFSAQRAGLGIPISLARAKANNNRSLFHSKVLKHEGWSTVCLVATSVSRMMTSGCSRDDQTTSSENGLTKVLRMIRMVDTLLGKSHFVQYSVIMVTQQNILISIIDKGLSVARSIMQ